MSRSVFNWTFDEIVRFLRDHQFNLNHVEGSHYFYTGYANGSLRQVCIPFHGKRAIDPKTFKSIILQSGIAKNVWLA